MDIREIAKRVWTEQDVEDMLVNIMDLAKSGSLKHADYVFKVMTYEPKADLKGQLQIQFTPHPIDLSKLSNEELEQLDELQRKIGVS